MPTLRRNRGNIWLARVVLDGKQVACRQFPPGKKGGPEWRAAKEWEEEQLKIALTRKEQEQESLQTLSALEKLLAWGEEYLAHAQRTMSRQTYVEKRTVMKGFFAFCRSEGIENLESVSKGKAYKFLSALADKKGGKVANKTRKNLIAAWNWGGDFVEGFPQTLPPFRKVKAFPVEKGQRYVPPEEDVIKVLQQARGQDLVFLLTMYFTGARRGEVFRLTWKDVSLNDGKIRLTDNKARTGEKRVRWLEMHPELVKALSWWKEARPCMVNNVFMQTHNDSSLGLPYRARLHFMDTLCRRAGVKPFGFHAIRHKSAAIAFVSKGLNAAQVLMGHYRATTTDIYVRSAGLYAPQGMILEALGNSGIGQAIGGLLEREMPRKAEAPEAFCNQNHVTNMAQKQKMHLTR
jgi:integrase